MGTREVFLRLDHLGQFQAGHAGHANVQNEQREFLDDQRH